MVTGFRARNIVPVEVFLLLDIVTWVISIDENFSFSIVFSTEYRVSIRIVPITILPPCFSFASHSFTMSDVSPPVPPIKITSAQHILLDYTRRPRA